MNRQLVVLVCLLCAACSRDKQAAKPTQPAAGEEPRYTANSVAVGNVREPATIGPGRIASIYGTGLGPAAPCSSGADPVKRETPSSLRPHQTLIEVQVFPTRLCETEVQVDGKPAGLLYVSEGQINFKAPQELGVGGPATLVVIYRGRPGPVVLVPLGGWSGPPAQELADAMYGKMQQIPWRKVEALQVLKSRSECSAWHGGFGIKVGLHAYAYGCLKRERGLVVETFYYPAFDVKAGPVLLRTDFRLAVGYPELEAEVERLLIARLQKAGATRRSSGDDARLVWTARSGHYWRLGDTVVHPYRGPSQTAASGVRTGAVVTVLPSDFLEKLTAAQRTQTAFASQRRELAPQVEAVIPVKGKSIASLERALEELLGASGEGSRNERAFRFVAADAVTVRLGEVMVSASHKAGGEVLSISPEATRTRAKLELRGIRYEGPGHYSGVLEYDRSFLRRASTEFPETEWGQRAALGLQAAICSNTGMRCEGTACYKTVIRDASRILERYPNSPVRPELIYHLAVAYDTWWSVSASGSAGVMEEDAAMAKSGSAQARTKAIALYRQLIQVAPDSLEAADARNAVAWLELGLSTGERRFLCSMC